MSEGEQTHDRTGGTDGAGLLERFACQMPGIPGGCPNVIEQYTGTGGRKPKYCGQTVDGVPHTRYTALRVRASRCAALISAAAASGSVAVASC